MLEGQSSSQKWWTQLVIDCLSKHHEKQKLHTSLEWNINNRCVRSNSRYFRIQLRSSSILSERQEKFLTLNNNETFLLINYLKHRTKHKSFLMNHSSLFSLFDFGILIWTIFLNFQINENRNNISDVENVKNWTKNSNSKIFYEDWENSWWYVRRYFDD